MTIREASEALGIKVRTMREWIRQGKIKAEKFPNSNRWCISNDDVNRILESRGM